MNIQQLAKFIFPDNIYCIRCGKIIDSTRIYSLCDDCVRNFHWANKKTCDKCGKIVEEEGIYILCKDCRHKTHYFQKGFTCLMYGLYERELIWAFKYGKQGYMAEKLGEILVDRMEPEFENGLAIDIIMPVPIHKKKLRQRGFNQAELMARPLAKGCGLPLESKALLRKKSTPAMSNLDSVQRSQNIAGAFVIEKGKEELVTEKSILLVDDVYTTGSTVDECSRVLLEAGAKEVYVVTIAAGAN
jgi:competence protein ComFC